MFLLSMPGVLQDSDDEKDNKVVKKPEREPESETETPSKTPPRTPPKLQEKLPKPAKPVKTPTPGKVGGKPPKPEQREEVIRTNRELAVVKIDKGGRDLLDVLKEVDDCFLRAAESGEDVSRMLETKKAHYHSSFSDNLRGTLLSPPRCSSTSIPIFDEVIMFLGFGLYIHSYAHTWWFCRGGRICEDELQEAIWEIGVTGCTSF